MWRVSLITKEEEVELASKSTGRIGNVWVKSQGGLYIVAVHFWQSEGWTVRVEALMQAVSQQTARERSPWLIARDADKVCLKCAQI